MLNKKRPDALLNRVQEEEEEPAHITQISPAECLAIQQHPKRILYDVTTTNPANITHGKSTRYNAESRQPMKGSASKASVGSYSSQRSAASRSNPRSQDTMSIEPVYYKAGLEVMLDTCIGQCDACGIISSVKTLPVTVIASSGEAMTRKGRHAYQQLQMGSQILSSRSKEHVKPQKVPTVKPKLRPSQRIAGHQHQPSIEIDHGEDQQGQSGNSNRRQPSKRCSSCSPRQPCTALVVDSTTSRAGQEAKETKSARGSELHQPSGRRKQEGARPAALGAMPTFKGIDLWVRDGSGKMQPLPLQIAPSAFGESHQMHWISPHNPQTVHARQGIGRYKADRVPQSTSHTSCPSDSWDNSTKIRHSSIKTIEVVVPILRSRGKSISGHSPPPPDRGVHKHCMLVRRKTMSARTCSTGTAIDNSASISPAATDTNTERELPVYSTVPTAQEEEATGDVVRARRPLIANRNASTTEKEISKRSISKQQKPTATVRADIGLIESLVANLPGVNISSGNIDSTILENEFKEFQIREASVAAALLHKSVPIPEIPSAAVVGAIAHEDTITVEISGRISRLPSLVRRNGSIAETRKSTLRHSESISSVTAQFQSQVIPQQDHLIARRLTSTAFARNQAEVMDRGSRAGFGKDTYMGMQVHPCVMSPPFLMPARYQILFGPYFDSLEVIEDAMARQTYSNSLKIHN
ncbi:hypothetical protein BASA84_000435 [Batrachochytrium salamandrivorans]|nr:hypothetical protein BASA84_000435 [Batrachochytrium salamandrivorans]